MGCELVLIRCCYGDQLLCCPGFLDVISMFHSVLALGQRLLECLCRLNFRPEESLLVFVQVCRSRLAC